MEWEKAKNIVILLLVILNIGLFGLKITEKNQYRMSVREQEAAAEVLAARGMTLSCDWVLEHAPMRELAVTIPAMDINDWRDRLFAEDETVTLQVDFDRSFLHSESQILMLANNQLSLMSEGNGAVEPFTQENAQAVAEAFLQMASPQEGNLSLGDVEAGDGYYIFTYYNMYKGYALYSCFRKITVTPAGVTAYFATYYNTQGFTSEKKSICSAAEALLTLCYELEAQEENAGGPYVVEEISLGYDFMDEQTVEAGNTLTMVPCYFVRVSGFDDPFIIQAYTNQLIHP